MNTKRLALFALLAAAAVVNATSLRGPSEGLTGLKKEAVEAAKHDLNESEDLTNMAETEKPKTSIFDQGRAKYD